MNAIANNVTPDWTTIDTQLRHEGKQIVLPENPSKMEIPDAVQTLLRIQEQENQKFDVSEKVIAAPWDAIVCLYMAMQDIYGVVMAESRQTFFGEIKPDFLTVNTGYGPGEKVQVPVGQMSLPGVADPVRIGFYPGGAFISGSVRKRDKARLIEIANRAREILKERSIYRSRAIRIGVDDDGDLDMSSQPEFLDLSRVKVTDMIHTPETEALIRTNIFALLEHAEACRRNNIPLKRGVLLEGRYGTGKSLTARVTAKVGTDNGWTFIILDRAQGLKAAIEFARSYQPCVIFAEDIDRAADRDNESVNDLVNLIDGVISKDMEILTVLTTNFIENIDRSLLRPGRFDAVISIQPPDAATAERVVRAYARDLLAADVDLSRVGGAIAGQIPATIREVVERAKLAMLVEERTFLTEDDLYFSAIGMRRHMELLNPVEAKETPAEVFFNAFKGMMGEAMTNGEQLDEIGSQVNTSRTTILSHVAAARRDIQAVGAAASSAAGSAEEAHTNTKKLLEQVGEVKSVVC